MPSSRPTQQLCCCLDVLLPCVARRLIQNWFVELKSLSVNKAQRNGTFRMSENQVFAFDKALCGTLDEGAFLGYRVIQVNG